MSVRHPSPTYRPVVLTIAGSDSGGGAGIQADIKAIEAAGCFATTAITAITAQNTLGVQDVDVLDTATIEAQLASVTDDLGVAAVKTGMLATGPVIETVNAAISNLEVPTVVDPVMVAASGDRLLDAEAEAAYTSLIEDATIVTPNADEATVLTDIEIDTFDDAVDAGRSLCDLGAEAALIKGGHWGGERIEDILVTDDGEETITHDRIDTDATHGSGCFLASTIAANLARGETLSDAVTNAIVDTSLAIRYHLDIGGGPGSVHHLASIRTRAAVAETLDRADTLVRRLRTEGVEALIPEVGMNIGLALPHAETPLDIVGIDGRLVRTSEGVHQAGPVRLGGSGHVARYLLSVREFEPAIRAAANCRFDDDIEAAMHEIGWPLLEVDRGDQPDAVATHEGGTMSWVAATAYEGDRHPVAVFDRGAPGKEAMVRVVATSPDELEDRLRSLAETVGDAHH